RVLDLAPLAEQPHLEAGPDPVLAPGAQDDGLALYFQNIALDPGEKVQQLIGQDGGRKGGARGARGTRRLSVARAGLGLREGERDGPKQERKGETRQETAHHPDTIAPPLRAGNLSERKKKTLNGRKKRGMGSAAPCPALLSELGYVLERDPEPRGAGVH